MIMHKPIRVELVVSSLIVLMVIALLIRPGQGEMKHKALEHSVASCCLEQEAGVSVHWYRQCEPAVGYTDWQLLM